LFLPYIVRPASRSLMFRPLSKGLFWFFFITCFILGWLGAKPAAYPYVLIAQIFTFLYFFSLLCLFPMIAWLESAVWFDKKEGVK